MLGRMIFEFEDSEVAEVTQQGDALHIRFSAARLYDAGRTGAGEGLWQPLLLICKQVAHANKAPEPHLTEILTAIGRVQRAELLLEGLPAGQRLRPRVLGNIGIQPAGADAVQGDETADRHEGAIAQRPAAIHPPECGQTQDGQ